MNKIFSSAQQKLLERAEQAMQSGKEEVALFLLQALLQSAPDSLETRGLARQAARVLYFCEKQNKKQIFFKKIKAFFVIVYVKGLFAKKQFVTALSVLEKLLGALPDFIPAHRLMSEAALKTTPPLLGLALFALEELVALQPKNISFYLELARVALLPEAHGVAWQPRRALQAYEQILLINPDHLEARAGIKNAEALFFIKEDGWSSAETYRDVLRCSN